MSRHFLAAALIGLAGPAFAQTAPALLPPSPTNPCFEVIALPHDPAVPAIAVLVDRCTGKTWSLARTVNGVMWFPIPEFKPGQKPE